MSTIPVVLAMAIVLDVELEQFDVETAFSHGNHDKEISITQLEGFIEGNKENLFCRLIKSLYGLNQLPRCWYMQFDPLCWVWVIADAKLIISLFSYDE